MDVILNTTTATVIIENRDNIAGIALAAQAAAEAAELGSETAQTASEASQAASESAQAAAELSETGAETAKAASQAARDLSLAARDTATTQATTAAGSATNAQAAQTASEAARDLAITAKDQAQTAATNAASQLSLCEDQVVLAQQAVTDAQAQVGLASDQVALSAAQVILAADQVALATAQKNLAIAAKVAAETAETNAGSSETAAASSASASATSASEAEAAKDAVEAIADFTNGKVYQGDGTGIAALSREDFGAQAELITKSVLAFNINVSSILGNHRNSVWYNLGTPIANVGNATETFSVPGVNGNLVKMLIKHGSSSGNKYYLNWGIDSSNYYEWMFNRQETTLTQVVAGTSTLLFSTLANPSSFGLTGAFETIDIQLPFVNRPMFSKRQYQADIMQTPVDSVHNPNNATFLGFHLYSSSDSNVVIF
jgi:hypothetical protein